ncbi:histamine H1 receptor [Carcharodon carcharias]|uniref:histamine H1 receptor n=1 Tax=Carcharodon carcharias TaxID=13397 RepID=UPI001B7E1508|nr:histamine H1 receptor [Carcharodon carcharias]
MMNITAISIKHIINYTVFTTENYTKEDYHQQRSAKKILLGLALAFLSLLTVIMNVLVLYAVKSERKLHTVANMYIVSLSVADLTVGMTVMPLNIMYILENKWKLGRMICQFWLSMDYMASTASIFSLFILCVDRYHSVHQPLRYLKYRTKTRAVVMIAGAWLLSLTWIIPILGWHIFANGGIRSVANNKCDTEFRYVTWFKILTAILNFYVPSILMLWYYTKIYMVVRKHCRQRNNIGGPMCSGIDRKNFKGNVNLSWHKCETCLNQQGENSYQELPTTEAKNTCKLSQCRFNCSDLKQIKMPSTLVGNENIPAENNQDIGAFSISASMRQISTDFYYKSLSLNKAQNQHVEPDYRPNYFVASKENLTLDNPAVTAKLKCFPLSVQYRQQGSNTQQTYVMMKEHKMVAEASVDDKCKLSDISDIQTFNKVLLQFGSMPCPHPKATSWVHESEETIGTDSINQLKQSWQRFFSCSVQHVQRFLIVRERKAVKQLGFIVTGFMVCWIPYFVTFTVMAFCDTCVNHNLHMFTIWLGYINSTLNPFIYPLCNKNFKKTFKTILHIQT